MTLLERLRVETRPRDRSPPDRRPAGQCPVAGRALLERLRLETATEHDRIEQTVDLTGRLASRDGYRAMLERFYGFHAAWEAEVAPLIADRAFFDPRRKVGLLRRDLRALGLDERVIDTLPRCAALMPLDDAASAFGAMYVVEGSTLGGAVISKHVGRTLGIGPDSGCAYFRSYGPDIARMWSAFRERLLALSSPERDDLIVASAQRTFGVLQGWLSQEQAECRQKAECEGQLA